MKLRSLLVGLVAATALGLTAPGAMAGDFCVGVSLPRCPVATYGLSTAGIISAEDAADANPGADSVVVAPHVFDLIEPLTLVPASDTTIVGAGVGQTIFQGAYPGQDVLSIVGEPGSRAGGFTVRVDAPSANGSGLSVMRSNVSDFAVEKFEDSPSNSAGFSGLEIGWGGTAHDGTIDLATYGGIGIHADYKSGTAYNLDVRTSTPSNTGTGIYVNSSEPDTELNFHHVKIKGFTTGLSVGEKKVTLTDSLIDLGAAASGFGVAAEAYDGKTIDLNVERVTIVGSGTDQTGLSLYSADLPSGLNARVSDVVTWVSDSGVSTYSAFDCRGASSSVNTAFMDLGFFAAIGSWQVDTGCGFSFETGKFTELLFVDPGFRNAAAGDYRLVRTSPLIDKGSTAGTLADSDQDLAGGRRAVDGDGDGTVKTDLGAFEYQRAAPQVSISASATSVLPGAPIAFNAAVSDAEGEEVTLAWSFDDGASAGNVSSVSHAFAAVGQHTATLTAIDQAEAKSTAVAVVTVNPFPRVAPTARIAAKPKKAFKAGKKGFAVVTKGSPTFSVTFADAVGARFKIAKQRGSQTLKVKSGTNKFTFAGFWNKKQLKPGTYKVTIAPLDSTGVSGTPVTLTLKLKR
ncbi:MAG: PKD domain-containing protein [Thermoleophilaceae bacterium]|nr:PKD domain-containing protein [Thermoleophilaceae bacterium]